MGDEFLVKEVHRPDGEVKKIILEFRGNEIIFEANHGKLIRRDLNGKIPGDVWSIMIKRIHGIFTEKRKNGKKFKKKFSKHYNWFETLEKNGIFIFNSGELKISRWNKKKKSYQNITDLPAAVRMQEHILRKYGIGLDSADSEKGRIETFAGLLKKINRLLISWRKSKDKREEIEQELAFLLSNLNRCRNDLKTDAKDQIIKMVGLRDCLGRENSGAMAARSIAALNKLSERVGQIKERSVKTAFRRELLIAEMSREREIIKSMIPEINLLLNFRALKHGFKPHEIPIFLSIVKKCADKLNAKFTEPYFSTAKEIKNALENIEEQIKDIYITKEILSLIKILCEIEIKRN